MQLQGMIVERRYRMCDPKEEDAVVEEILESVNADGGGGDAEPEADGAGMGAPSNEGAGSYAETLDGGSGEGSEGN